MNNVPSICYSICGVCLLVSLPLLIGFWRVVSRAPLRNDWD